MLLGCPLFFSASLSDNQYERYPKKGVPVHFGYNKEVVIHETQKRRKG